MRRWSPLGGKGDVKKLLAVVALVAVGSLVLASCGDDDDSDDDAAASENVLRVIEDDYSFDISGEPTAGTLTIDVSNVGEELHMFGACELLDGKTEADVQTALQSEDEAAFGEVCKEDTVIDGLGGGITPGSRVQVTASGVEAGNYVAICFIPDEEGKPHFAHGMVKPFVIREGDGTAELPEADVTYTATKEKLDGPKEIDAGETTIEFVPEQGGRDEFVLLKLKDGKTADDVDAFFAKMDEGGFYTDAESPVDLLYFAFDHPEARTITVDLTEGNWAISATNSDEEDPNLDPDEDPHVIQFTVS